MHFWGLGWTPLYPGEWLRSFVLDQILTAQLLRGAICLFPVIFSYIPFGITASPTSSLKVSESWARELIEGCSHLGSRLILRTPLVQMRELNKDSSTTEGGGD